MSKCRYKIILEVYNEEPYFLANKTMVEDTFVYDESLTNVVLKNNFEDMLKLLNKGE